MRESIEHANEEEMLPMFELLLDKYGRELPGHRDAALLLEEAAGDDEYGAVAALLRGEGAPPAV